MRSCVCRAATSAFTCPSALVAQPPKEFIMSPLAIRVGLVLSPCRVANGGRRHRKWPRTSPELLVCHNDSAREYVYTLLTLIAQSRKSWCWKTCRAHRMMWWTSFCGATPGGPEGAYGDAVATISMQVSKETSFPGRCDWRDKPCDNLQTTSNIFMLPAFLPQNTVWPGRLLIPCSASKKCFEPVAGTAFRWP
jgi:hypothetical protein